MGRREGEIEKERIFRLRLLLDVLHRALGRGWNVLIGIPIRYHRSRTALPTPLFDWLPLLGIHHRVRRFRDAIVLDPAIRREVDDRIAKVVIEAMSQRSVGNRSRPIESVEFDRFLLSRLRRFLAQGIPVPAQVPFSNDRCSIALAFQHFGQSQSLVIEDRSAQGIDDTMELPPVMSARQ